MSRLRGLGTAWRSSSTISHPSFQHVVFLNDGRQESAHSNCNTRALGNRMLSRSQQARSVCPQIWQTKAFGQATVWFWLNDRTVGNYEYGDPAFSSSSKKQRRNKGVRENQVSGTTLTPFLPPGVSRRQIKVFLTYQTGGGSISLAFALNRIPPARLSIRLHSHNG